jgi:hypothetical protein
VLSARDEARSPSAIKRLFNRGGLWRARRVKAMCLDSRRARWRALRTFLTAQLKLKLSRVSVQV